MVLLNYWCGFAEICILICGIVGGLWYLEIFG